MKTIAQQINWDFEANGSLVIRNENAFLIYYEDSDGFWEKREYDSERNQIYYENSTGFWTKREYDSKGNEIYFEDSGGDVEDNRHKPSEDRVIEIEAIEINGVKYKLTKL